MSPADRSRRTAKPTQRLLDAQEAGLLGSARGSKAKTTKATKTAKKTGNGNENGNDEDSDEDYGDTEGAEQASAPKAGPWKLRTRKSHQRAKRRGKQRGPPPRVYVPLTGAQRRARDALANIYYEIDKYATRPKSQDFTANEKRASQTEADAIHTVLRQARMIRSLGQISSAKKVLVVTMLQDFETDNKDVTAAVALGNADWSLEAVFQSRFNEFFGLPSPNLSILSICAHSKTFRDTLFRLDEDSVEQGLPVWGDLLGLIQNNTSSLELFAEVRALPWEAALDQGNDHFALLLKHVFVGACSITNDATPNRDSITSKKNFGIKPDDESVVHVIDDDKRNQALWVVQLDSTHKAKRNHATVTVTDDTLAEFRVIFKDKHPNLKFDDKIEISQEDIQESVILDDYEEDWPDWLQRVRNQTTIEPRFTNKECCVCKKEGTRRIRIGRTRLCTCDFVDLRDHLGLENVLFELVETGVLGTGVRALQDVSKGAPIAEYAGEIYPQAEDRYFSSIYTYIANIPKASNPTKEKESYNIDSMRYGNWTRYINHSCNSNTKFVQLSLGHLQYIAVIAHKNIKFGDQLTIDYGSQSFQHQNFGCKCGMACCTNWIEKAFPDERENKLTLRKAKARLKAPIWAMKDDNVPYNCPLPKTLIKPPRGVTMPVYPDSEPEETAIAEPPESPKLRASKRRQAEDDGPRRSKRQRR